MSLEGACVLAARGVSASCNGAPALRGVSFDLSRHEVIGVIGPPDAGKTTLLKAIAGLVPLERGEIWSNGERVDNSTGPARSAWQSRIGMSFQNDALLDGLTVFGNVAFPLRRRGRPEQEVEQRVRRSLEEVGLLDDLDKLPSELSGGMRKRVGIARAAVLKPEIGLFDDPIAGLDPVSAGRILDLVVGLARSLGMATMVVSHDLPVLLPICHRVLMLHGGEVVFDGAPAALPCSLRPEVVQFATGSNEGPL